MNIQYHIITNYDTFIFKNRINYKVSHNISLLTLFAHKFNLCCLQLIFLILLKFKFVYLIKFYHKKVNQLINSQNNGVMNRNGICNWVSL